MTTKNGADQVAGVKAEALSETDRALRLAALIQKNEHGLTPELIQLRPPPLTKRERAEEVYDLNDPKLVGAIMTALLLGQPLVLAGEPGVGKTQLARRLKAAIGLHLHKVTHVSTSLEGRKLLYEFDEVGRFRDAEKKPLRDYVEFKPLGLAILWSAGPTAMVSTDRSGGWKDVIGTDLPGDSLQAPQLPLGTIFPNAFKSGPLQITEPTPSIVLLDEFDKAPRDAPNDLLATVEQMTLRINELGIDVSGNVKAWPVLIITSNSERMLPDAFLRRCVFHWIDFPENALRLQKIVALHCAKADQGGAAPGDPEQLEQVAKVYETKPLVKSSVQILWQLRDSAVNKKPATAELIGFVMALRDMGVGLDQTVTLADKAVQRALGLLLKTREDVRAMPAPTPAG